MAKKQPENRNRKGDGRKRSYFLGHRIYDEYGKALEAWITATRPNPQFAATLELAIEEFLQKRGAWPPPAK